MNRIQKQSREDYLEAILLLSHRSGGTIRSAELARFMEFSKASICRAVAALKAEGLLRMDESCRISLTDRGAAEAEQVYQKHCFFERQLLSAGVDAETASREACLMEHILSNDSFEKLRNTLEPGKMTVEKERAQYG